TSARSPMPATTSPSCEPPPSSRCKRGAPPVRSPATEVAAIVAAGLLTWLPACDGCRGRPAKRDAAVGSADAADASDAGDAGPVAGDAGADVALDDALAGDADGAAGDAGA